MYCHDPHGDVMEGMSTSQRSGGRDQGVGARWPRGKMRGEKLGPQEMLEVAQRVNNQGNQELEHGGGRFQWVFRDVSCPL